MFRERKTHKHKQICGIVPGLGGCQKVVYVFFFVGSFLMGEKKHINKIPPKIPGQSRENFVYVFFSLCVFFSLPIINSVHTRCIVKTGGFTRGVCKNWGFY